jgi:hypothetical protein
MSSDCFSFFHLNPQTLERRKASFPDTIDVFNLDPSKGKKLIESIAIWSAAPPGSGVYASRNSLLEKYCSGFIAIGDCPRMVASKTEPGQPTMK